MCKQWALCVFSREIWDKVYFHLVVLQGLLKDEEERQAENSLPHFRVSSNILFVIQMLVMNYLLAMGETPLGTVVRDEPTATTAKFKKIIKRFIISLRFLCVFDVWYWCKLNSLIKVAKYLWRAMSFSVCCTEENTAL